jgi:hypothetical protein
MKRFRSTQEVACSRRDNGQSEVKMYASRSGDTWGTFWGAHLCEVLALIVR